MAGADSGAADVTAIIPTYRRKDALLLALVNHTALRGVAEVVVVDDGSDDGTADAVLAARIPGVRLVRHEENRGLPAARNTGVRAASTDWVVFLEDDCGFPEDYVEVLRSTAAAYRADIVGAPWTCKEPQRETSTMLRSNHFTLLTAPWTFPSTALETPFMPALALVRRLVFDRVCYDEAYRGNFYREETDFYVSAQRAGFRVFLTPLVASWQLGHFAGGCKGRFRLRNDYWATRNTARLLRKHGSFLRAEGLLATSSATVLMAVAWPRLRYYLERPFRALRWAWRRACRVTGIG